MIRDNRGLPAKRISVHRGGREAGRILHLVRKNAVCVIVEGTRLVAVVVSPEYTDGIHFIGAIATVGLARRRNPGGVFTLADELLGSERNTNLWMGREIEAFSGKRPVDMLTTTEGIEEVLDLFNRVQHGIFT